MESSGWSALPGRPSASSDLFDQEVERATERAGGREAVDDRLDQARGDRRADRREGFDEHQDRTQADRAERRSRRRPSHRDDETAPHGNESVHQRPIQARARHRAAQEHQGPAHPRTHGQHGHGPHMSEPSTPAGGPDVTLTGTAQGQPFQLEGAAAARPAHMVGSVQARATAATPTAPVAGRPEIATQRPEAGARATAPEAPRQPAPDQHVERATEVLRQIRLQLTAGMRQATIDLLPAELGRVQVRIKMDEGRVDALVRAESAATAELLERHLPELRDALAKQGIEVEGFDLRHDESLGDRSAQDPSTGDAQGRAADHGAPALADRLQRELLHRVQNIVGDDAVDTYA